MRQPAPPDTIMQLREFLRFAVPLAAADLLADRRTYPSRLLPMWEKRLHGEVERAGLELGHRGDQMTYASGYPAQRKGAIVGAGQLALGIAAAALLAGPAGITALGDHYRP